jgi:hypothetical protein
MPEAQSGRRVRVLTVNPELAAHWLDQNTRNRHPDKARVDTYARIMREGRWILGNDAVAFDSEGVLVNGQKRLMALMESGTTHRFIVLEGVDPEDQNVMDVGQPRRAGQQLHILGWKNGNIAAGIVRVIIRWHAGAMTSKYAPQIDEIALFADNHADKLLTATDVAARVGRRTAVNRMLAGAVCFTALDLAQDHPDKLKPETVLEFFELLETGANMETNNPIMVLRERTMRYSNASGSRRIRQTETEQLGDLIRTWNAWRKGRRYTKLQPGTDGQNFTLKP